MDGRKFDGRKLNKLSDKNQMEVQRKSDESRTDVRRKLDGRQMDQGRSDGNVLTCNAATTMALQLATLRCYCCCYSLQLCDAVTLATTRNIALLLLLLRLVTL